MILRSGDMWLEKPDVFVVTTNNTVREDGRLVMGRGAAAAMVRRFPRCDYHFGELVVDYLQQKEFRPGRGKYGVMAHLTQRKPEIAIFQVKYNYASVADEDIIAHSVKSLTQWANGAWKGKRIVMNFPGIGYGGLRREDVLPLLKPLPANVEIWEYT